MTIDVVNRVEWDAKSPKADLEPANHPFDYVIYTHNTEVERCHNDDECKLRMQELQQRHMDAGAPDIYYNFLIGGNGKAYEGRGWWNQPDKSLMYAEHHGKRVDIAYIGNYGTDLCMHEPMWGKAIELVMYGIDEDFIYREHYDKRIN